MADEFKVNAKIRPDKGKGASRRLRHTEQIPAVIYGAGLESVALSIAAKDIEKSASNEAFFAHIIQLNVDNKSESAIVKALQRHPASSRIMHVDFQRVQMDQAIHVDVPLHFTNEDTCVGVKAGGMVSHLMTSLNIVCLPGNLPEYIEVDVADMAIGMSLHMSELALPKGINIPELAQGTDHDQVVVAVVSSRAAKEDEEEAEAATADDTEAPDKE